VGPDQAEPTDDWKEVADLIQYLKESFRTPDPLQTPSAIQARLAKVRFGVLFELADA